MRRVLAIVGTTVVALAAPAAARAAAPGAATGGATNIGAQGATLTGTVKPNGKPTQYHFQYGQTKAYGQSSASQTVQPGRGSVQVRQAVGGLKPDTQYHYRLVATNGDGTTAGRDRTFRTRKPDPNALLLAPSTNPVVFGHQASLAGQLRGPNHAGVGVTLFAKAATSSGDFAPVAGPVATDAAGNYAFALLPGANALYRTVAATPRSTTSGIVGVGVVANVKLGVSDRSVRAGTSVRFSGIVLPAMDGGLVSIQKLSSRSGTYVTVAHARLTGTTPQNDLPRSRYARRLRLRSSGIFRALVAGTPDLTEGTSRRVAVHVR
jgi:hypothetical protein